MSTYNFTSAQVPTILAPTTAAIGNGVSGPFASLMTDPIVSYRLNQVASAIPIALGQCGGGGYGRLSGLVVSATSGLGIALGAGVGMTDGMIELVASNPVGPQALIPNALTLANNATNFVWFLQGGGWASTTVLGTPPTNARFLLAVVVTSGGAVTSIDSSGCPYIIGGKVIRITADRSAPVDSPPAGAVFDTITQGGHYTFNGQSYVLLQGVTNGQVITATLTGTMTGLPQDNGYQLNLTASGADQIYLLPNPASLPSNFTLNIFNVGGTHNIVIKDYTGTTTLCTIAPGNCLGIRTYMNSSGNTVFPGGTWTAGAPPTPGAVPV